MPESGAEKPFEEVLREHEELRNTISKLREFVAARQPEIHEEGCHPWAASLLARIATLHDRVCCHFRREEAEGLLDRLTILHPQAAREIENLKSDHDKILADIRDLMVATLSYSEGKSPDDPKLSGRLGRILDNLVDHEKSETDLITRVEYDDIGTAD